MKEVTIPGWKKGPVYFSPKIDSTSDQLRILAEKGAPPGTVIWAGKQTRGRGRQGKKWVSPSGNLYFSVLFFSEKNIDPSFSLVAGGAVIKALENEGESNLQIKWPNDIILNGSKVGGILCENFSGKLIVGIGLNLVPMDFMVENNSFPPGNLSEFQKVPGEKIIGCILKELDRDFWIFKEKGFFFFREELVNKSFLMDRRVQVDDLTGRVASFGNQGQLIIELPDGSKKEIWQGSIFLKEEG